MFRLPLDKVTPYDKFKEYLEEGTKIYLDVERAEQSLSAIKKKMQSRFEQIVTTIYGVTGMRPNNIQKNVIIGALIDSGIPEEYFCKYRGNEPIYYNQKVREKIIANDYINDLFMLYDSYTKLSSQHTSTQNVLGRNSAAKRITGDAGQELVEIKYNVKPITNLRFSTVDENVIGFSGELRSSISAPEDFHILSFDFPQIDARSVINLYLRNPKLRQLAFEIDDMYLLLKEYARYVQHEKDKATLEEALNLPYFTDVSQLEKKIENYNPNVEPFDSKATRDIYKVTALKTAYYAQYSAFREETDAMNTLKLMYQSTERYKRQLAMSKLMFDLGVPIAVKSRWGHQRLIVERDLRATISNVFNAPAQTTSSEIIIHYVTHFLDYFRNQGIGEDKVRICLNRHDEPIFYIHKEVYAEHYFFIASMQTVLVEGWAPFKLEMYVGPSYKTNDPDAIALLERVPDEIDKAKFEAQKYIDQEEPYSLVEPELCYLSYRRFGGVLRVAVVRNVGEFVTDDLLFGGYVDNRKFKLSIYSLDVPDTHLTAELVQFVAQKIAQSTEPEKPLVVMGDIHGIKEFGLADRTVYVRPLNDTLGHRICRGALATMVREVEPDSYTLSDRQDANVFKENKGRIVT